MNDKVDIAALKALLAERESFEADLSQLRSNNENLVKDYAAEREEIAALVGKWNREATTIKATLGHHSDPKDRVISETSMGVRSMLANELRALFSRIEEVKND